MTRARTGAGARGWLGVAGLCALTAAVWADVASSGVLARLDEPVLDALRAARDPVVTVVAVAVTDLGGGWGRCALGVVVGVLAARRERAWWPVVAVALGLAVAPALNGALKALLDRERPPLGQALLSPADASFPSGHAMGAAAAAVVLGWVVTRTARRPGAAAPAAAAAVVFAVAVGVTRVYLGVHWPTDVLAGWAAGAAVGWAVVLAVRPRAAAPTMTR